MKMYAELARENYALKELIEKMYGPLPVRNSVWRSSARRGCNSVSGLLVDYL